ncbi:MAG: class I SAM-dependent methyltransferase [Bacteroidales bacterium]|jgi:predicted TPR repeat methyltransferase
MTDYFKNKASEWDSPMKVEMSVRFVEEMVRNVKFNKSVKAMDLGCGTGLVGLSILNEIKSLIMVDNSNAMIDKLKEKLEVIEQNNETTLKEKVKIINGSVDKYTANDLDVVFSLMAIHHIENIEALFEHISKILNPGGVLVVGDLCEEDGSFHGEESVPHNGFNIESLSKQMEAFDIDIVTTYTYNTIKKNNRDYDQFIIIAKKI